MCLLVSQTQQATLVKKFRLSDLLHFFLFPIVKDAIRGDELLRQLAGYRISYALVIDGLKR